jgi:hypothetical protein
VEKKTTFVVAVGRNAAGVTSGLVTRTLHDA